MKALSGVYIAFDRGELTKILAQVRFPGSNEPTELEVGIEPLSETFQTATKLRDLLATAIRQRLQNWVEASPEVG